MKPRISISTLANIPLNYVIKYCTNIELILEEYPLTHINITKFTYGQSYSNFNYHLNNDATILINNNEQLSDYEYEVIGYNLKKHSYRFTQLYLNSKYSLKYVPDLINKLNPNISLLSKANLIMKYFLIKIFLHYQNKIFPLKKSFNQRYLQSKSYIKLFQTFYLNMKESIKSRKNNLKPNTIIYNPSKIDISTLKIKPLKSINYLLKDKKIKKYQEIVFIYEKYNVANQIYFYRIKQLCVTHKIRLKVIKI